MSERGEAGSEATLSAVVLSKRAAEYILDMLGTRSDDRRASSFLSFDTVTLAIDHSDAVILEPLALSSLMIRRPFGEYSSNLSWSHQVAYAPRGTVATHSFFLPKLDSGRILQGRYAVTNHQADNIAKDLTRIAYS